MKMDSKLNNSNDSFMRQIFQMVKAGFDGVIKTINSLNKEVQKVEIQGADVIRIKGEDGHTPTEEELLALIKPLVEAIPKPQDGHTPTEDELLFLIKPLIPELKTEEVLSDERLLELIKTLIPDSQMLTEEASKLAQEAIKPLIPDSQMLTKEASKLAQEAIKPLIPELPTTEQIADNLDNLPKEWLHIDHIRGDFNTKIKPVIVPPYKPEIRVFDSSNNEYYVDRINFTGNGVSVVKMGDRVVSVVIAGGGVGTVYTETPTGLINGSNTVYTTLHPITNVFSFAVNGQFLHPEEYTTDGNEITFINPLAADLAGTNFTIIYA